MRAPAARHPDYPVGRYCAVCGRGMSLRLGGLVGAGPILAAAGYALEPHRMYFAHVTCCNAARRAAPAPGRTPGK